MKIQWQRIICDNLHAKDWCFELKFLLRPNDITPVNNKRYRRTTNSKISHKLIKQQHNINK